jgi:glyoxylase-like metal-dependent hydrolase (beta-lactamase superfamily II)
MMIKQIAVKGFDKNFSYILADEVSLEAMIVDPVDFEKLMEILKEGGFSLIGILLTHDHFDHWSALAEVLEFQQVPVFAHEKVNPEIRELCSDFREIGNGDLVEIGQVKIEVLETPGHCESSLCFLAEGNLISGDTLFVGGCGRADLAGSDVQKLADSLFDVLKNLPPETKVFPGHDYGEKPVSTIGEEILRNKFLALGSKDEFVKKRMG